jgi:hypothetical protein
VSHETDRGTDRAFIAFVCRESQCSLGGSPCAMRTSGGGVIVAVQPTSPDELDRPRICGPLATNADLTEFCFWLEGGS